MSMSHYPGHLAIGVVALAATLAIQSLTVNRLVKRKLRLSLLLLGAYVIVNAVLAVTTVETLHVHAEMVLAAERLALAAAIINLLVVALINPLREDRVPDRFPRIVQDFLVIGLVLLAATFLSDKLIATSAVGAVVIGFALQDTLGNAFAGLAVQTEKPFHVGHWVRIGEFEGRVAEITWRATKLRTKTGNFVIVPNNLVSTEAITNYSEPASPTRIQVEVGASYLSAPNAVKAAIMEALANAPRVLKAPAPDVILASFDASAITYRARFWIDDYERDEGARDQVRTAIYYAFARHDIEIPWPIQVDYHRDWPQVNMAAEIDAREEFLEKVDVLATLTKEQRRDIAAAAPSRTFGAGETIVRQGEPGESMYVVMSGRVAVLLEPDCREVATIDRGGYFGEMSLLTGDPRTATIVTRGDTVVLEVCADLFRRLGAECPEAVEQVAVAAVTRRAQLEHVKEAAGTTVAVAPANLLARMRKFLHI
jgi:small-conductance mechanosensitive channel/CRP-like cAMP-binding protein